MRNLSILLFSLVAFYGTAQDFTIKGKINNGTKGKVSLQLISYPEVESDTLVLCVTDIATDGTFELSGKIASATLGKLIFNDMKDTYAAKLFVEPGTIHASLSIDGYGDYGLEGSIKFDELYGTPNNEVLTDYKKRYNQFLNTIGKNFKGYALMGEVEAMENDPNSDKEEIDQLRKKAKEMMVDFTKKRAAIKKDIHKDSNGSLASFYLLVAEGTNIKNSSFYGEEDLAIFLKTASPNSINSVYYNVVREKYSFTNAILSEGSKAPSFTLKNEEGNQVSLEDFKGKYVLIDFWAYYCKPCIKDFPELRKVYAKYKKSGLELISISVDQRQEPWLKGLKKHQNPWTQLIDQKRIEGDKKVTVSDDFSVPAMPSYYFIDKEGNVLSSNVLSERVIKKVEEVLGL